MKNDYYKCKYKKVSLLTSPVTNFLSLFDTMIDRTIDVYLIHDYDLLITFDDYELYTHLIEYIDSIQLIDITSEPKNFFHLLKREKSHETVRYSHAKENIEKNKAFLLERISNFKKYYGR